MSFTFQSSCVGFYVTIMLGIFAGFRPIHAEVFTAMSDVEALISAERSVVEVLQNLVRTELEKISWIQNYIDEFTKFYQQPDVNVEKVVSNPINAFLLVKHLSADWDRLRYLLSTNLGAVGVEEIERLRTTVRFPTEEDMKGAAEAVVRLQHTYELDEKLVANGVIKGISGKSPVLSSLDCYLLGLHQAQLGFHDYAARWLDVALQKYEDEERNNIHRFVKKTEILDWLQHTAYQNGNVSRALGLSETIKTIDPAFPHVDNNIEYYAKMISEIPEATLAKLEDKSKPTHVRGGTYEALCRGEGEVALRVQTKLRCYLETYNNPSLLLQPVKTEIAHVEPDVFILHDVVCSSQMERVKNLARRHLQRAMVVKPGTDEFEPTRIRISKSAFLRDEADPVVEQINRRIAQITNLNMRIAEDLQIANYGIGGHYDPHYDHFRTFREVNHKQIDKILGDRMATFLMYMSDVEAGGATVFPRINLTLYPEKGSAAFWFNLHRDGLGDENTLHAGCPVLSGSKWISNKWIREKSQDRSRPCSLQPDSPEWENGWPKYESDLFIT